MGWTTFGASLAPVALLVFGLLLAGSDPELNEAIGADPIGALSTLLPTWFLIPFAVVALAGLIGGAALDIYSSGLALLSLGLPAPRWVAAAIDGALMVVGAVYVVFVADSFIGPFQGFLITLGVPIAAMDTGGTRDILHAGTTGLLSSDPTEFARDLARLAADERLRASIGAAARADVRVRFAAPSVVERVEQVYRSLLEPEAA